MNVSVQVEGRRLNVLLVEDEVLIRLSTAEGIADMGYDVVDVGTIAETIDNLSNARFDVMVTDLGLPDGSGLDLIRNVSDHYRHMAIVVASGREIDTSKYPGLDRVIRLPKPYDDVSLKSAMVDALERCRET